MSSLSVDVPLVKSYVAKMAAQGASNQLVTLLELSEPMNGGAHYPLFLLVLQQLHKLHDSDWVTSTFQESKINLQDMLPGELRNIADLSIGGIFTVDDILNWQQGSHRHWKTWKNETTFSSRGKVKEF